MLLFKKIRNGAEMSSLWRNRCWRFCIFYHSLS